MTSGPPKFGPKPLEKVARVDRLLRMDQPIGQACKTVGITVQYYQKVKSLTSPEPLPIEASQESILGGTLCYGEEMEELPDHFTINEAKGLID